MASIRPNVKKRSYLLPPGCKDLIDVLQGAPQKPSSVPVRVNGRIRAPKVRVVGAQGESLGIMPLADALGLARSHNLDLIEIAPAAKPPICRILDFGKFRYEATKQRKKKS
jgi:translation initiation factor IF-3